MTESRLHSSSRPRVCVTTWYDQGFSSLGDLCLLSLAHYCRVRGFELRIPSIPASDRPPAWNKILVCQQLLEEGADFVLWVDADAVMVRTDLDFTKELDGDVDLALHKHESAEESTPNTGVLMLRNSDWTRCFLQEVWDQVSYVDHPWWENAAVLELLGFHGALQDGRSDRPDPERLAHIRWLQPEWNLLVGVSEHPDPVIRHYAGRKYHRRLANMQADLNSLQSPATPRGLRYWKYWLRRRLLGR